MGGRKREGQERGREGGKERVGQEGEREGGRGREREGKGR